jgi:hypothetical protein
MSLISNLPTNIPLALLAAVVMITLFARKRPEHRINDLNEIVKEDWLPRQKYIYINCDDFDLNGFVEQTIEKHKSNIIYDHWSEAENKWNQNEPDTYRRILTFMQDIAHDFDGIPHLLVALVDPNYPTFSNQRHDNFLYFDPVEGGLISFNGATITEEEVQAVVTSAIQNCLKEWDNMSKQQKSKLNDELIK